MTAEAIREGGEGIFVQLDVHPGARETRLGGQVARGAIRVDIAVRPEKGAANRALCAYLKALLGPDARVLLVRGRTSRRKTVLVVGIARDRVAKALARGNL